MRRGLLIIGLLVLSIPSIISAPSLMPHWGLLSLAFAGLTVLAMFLEFGERAASSRDISLTAMLGAVSAVVRVPFAALPGLQPSTFIVAVSGYVFGPVSGFMVGALTALISNLFLGMGPWTLYQMLAWGLVGVFFSALGWLGRRVFGPGSPARTCLRQVAHRFARGESRVPGLRPSAAPQKTEDRRLRTGKLAIAPLALFGFLWGYAFGFIMNLWYLTAFGFPLTLQSIVALQAVSFWMDTLHGLGNAAFFLIFGGRVLGMLERFRRRFVRF